MFGRLLTLDFAVRFNKAYEKRYKYELIFYVILILANESC